MRPRIFPSPRQFLPFILLSLFLSSCLPLVTPLPPLPTHSPAAPTLTLPSPTQPPTQTASPRPSQTLAPTATTVPSLTPRPKISRVLILSFDGLRPDAIALAPMPNLQALMQAGAYNLGAQTIFPSSTLPAHASMLTGECPPKTGVDWNDYLPERGYAQGVSIFELAHNAGLKTYMFVGKKKLIQITQPANLDGFRFINDRDTVVAETLAQAFPADFGVLFVHFATADDMGHNYGWLSPQQLSVIRRADEALGVVLAALDAHNLRADTLILATADHGGHEQTHGSRDPQDMTIPWVIAGPGVRPGQLTAPVQTTDTAATAAWALNLPIPAEWDGVPVLEAFGFPAQVRNHPFCK